MNSDQEYALHVDNDEVRGADNKITVFVNCKVKDAAAGCSAWWAWASASTL